MRSLTFLFFLGALCCSSVFAQSNDNFASRLTLTGTHPSAVSNNLSATRETNEPAHAGAGVGRSLWWTWTAPVTGVANFSTSYGGKGILPLRAIAVYTGDAVSALTEVASTNDLAQTYYTGGYPASYFANGNSLNVPVTAGTVYQIAVDALASSLYSGSDDGSIALAINALPTIISAASATANTGAYFTYSIVATAGASNYTASNLPAGLGFNATTGLISGTPTVAGVYNVDLTATSPGGTGTATLTLLVSDPAPTAPVVPVFSNAAGTNGTVGAALSVYLSATGAPTAYTAAPLPPGLSFNPTAGLISGTPTAAGITAVQISATGVGGTGKATLTFNILAAVPASIITSALAASGTTGAAFFASITTATDSSGTPYAPTGYTAANLPPGVTFTTATGQFGGTPTQAGVYSVPISVTNGGGTRSATVTITIADPIVAAPAAPAAPVLASVSTAAGVVGTAFSYQLSATGTPTSFDAGTLPPGLVLDTQKGAITGTPTQTGTFAVPVSATNSLGISTGTLTVTIAASTAAQNAAYGYALPVITSTASAGASVGKSFMYQVQALYQGSASGSTPGTWTFGATGLPPGLSIAATNSSGSTYISGTPTTVGVYPVTISVTCPASTSYYAPHPAATGSAVVTLIVSSAAITNAPPAIVSSAGAALTVGSSASYYISTTSLNGYTSTTYAATGLPPGLSVGSATSGYITGTPTTAGTYAATISATDTIGTGTATITFTVAPLPSPVITSQAAAGGTVGSSFSYRVSASSAPTSLGVGNLPPGLSSPASDGYITGTPTAAGVYNVPITATNASGTANATLTITINPAVTSAPVINSYVTAQAYVAQSFSYSIGVSTGTVSSYGASNLPPGLSLSSNGYITGTPTTVGTYPASISATNTVGTGTATLTINVSNPGVPVLSGYAALDAMVGQAFGYTLYASNSPTSFTFSGLPAGVTPITSYPGMISGTPTTAGIYHVTVSAANSTGAATATLTITVAPATPPAAPIIQSALNATGVVGTALSYTVLAGNAPTSYAIDNVPAGLTFSTATGALTGKPSAAGEYTLNISATNAGGTGRGVVNLRVAATPASVPIISSSSGTVAYPGEAFYYVVTASDSPTSYAASGLPTGLVINTSTGVISGTTNVASGSYPVTVSATNATGTGQATITILVSATAAPPHFTNALTITATVGQLFSKTLTCNTSASAFAVSNLPSGVTCNGSTGVISGTPIATGTYLLTVSANTPSGNASAFVYLVISAVAPTTPVFTSAAGVAGYAGEPLTYRLTAANSPTSFSASALPGGLTLNSSTGVITGTPVTTDTHAYQISAINSAGTSYTYLSFNLSSSTPYFSVQVSSPAAAGGYVGVPFTYALQLSPASSSWIVGASGLPPGLYLDTTNTISGTPTVAGTYTATISVGSYAFTNQDQIVFVITAVNTLPVINTAAGASTTIGNNFSYSLSANNSTTSYTASNLPAGLGFNAAAQSILGIPTVAGTYAIPVTAANAFGTATATLTLVVNPAAPLPAPSLAGYSNPMERAFVAGSSVSHSIYGSSSPTSYGASGLPPGLSVDTATGYISGTLTTAGTYPVTISAANAAGSSSAIVTYVINPATAVARPSLLFAAESVAYTGVAFSITLTQSYDNVTALTVGGLPPGLALNAATGVISGTATTPGLYTVNIAATNAGGTATAAWTLLVKSDSVLIPQFGSTPAEITGSVGQSFISYIAYTSVYDGNLYVGAACTYTVSGLPPGLTASTSGNSSYLPITGTPTTAGTYPVTITATGPGGGSSTETTTILIGSPSTPAITSAATVNGNVNVAFSYSLSISNPATSYSAGPLPDGLVFNASTGVISGTPITAGTWAVPVGATGAGGTATAVVNLRIGAALYGNLPLISSAATISSQDFPTDPTLPSYYQTLYPTTSVSYTLAAINKPTGFTAQNLPAGLSLNPVTGLISGLPTTPGTYQVPVTATNVAGTVSTTLTVIVTSPVPIVRSGLAYNSYVGGACSTTLSYTFPTFPNYPYGYGLYYGYPSSPNYPTYAASGLPPGLSINTYSGLIRGTATRSGTYPVTVAAISRGGMGTAILTYFIADTAPATTPATVAAPVFTSKTEALGFVRLPLSYTLTASRATSFAAAGLPAGLTLDPTTGAITGTPGAAGTFPVTVSAANAGGTVQATLSLTIEAAPTAPLVASATGVLGNIGTAFSYTLYSTNLPGMPAATNYVVDLLPAGLTLNSTNGRISGTPTGPVGTYPVLVTASVGSVASADSVVTITILPAPTTLPSPVLTSPAGALGLIGNPFSYVILNSAYLPSGTLPGGLTYDSTLGTIGGYPATEGLYQIPLTVPGANTSGLSATPSASPRRRKTGVVLRKPVSVEGHRLSGTILPVDGIAPPTAMLTLRVVAPDFSLPRVTVQPSGGVASTGTSFTFAAAAVGVPAPTFRWTHNGLPIPGANGPTLTLPTLQSGDAGDYAFTAVNVAGRAMSSTATLILQTTYADWQTNYFSPEQIAAGYASDGYSANGDGVTNLLRYALGLDPFANAANLLPVVAHGAGSMLGLSFSRDAGKQDINYLVEASTDLRIWVVIAQSVAGAPTASVNGGSVVTESAASGSSVRRITVQAVAPISGGTQFLRLQIVRP